MNSIMNNKKIVIAFSGGCDSSVLLFMAAAQGFTDIYTVSFDYGQRHIRELQCIKDQIDNVRNIYNNVQVSNLTLDVKFLKSIITTSSLTNEDIDNPNINKMAGDAQPVSYVPFRNQTFLSICCAYAESVQAETVWYGAAQADSLAGYWDGSKEFVDSYNSLISLNRQHRIKVTAPLINISKADIVREGVRLGVDFSKTWTCYSNRADGLADASTPSSSLRLQGFLEARYQDPIKYFQQDRVDQLYRDNNCLPINYNP